MHNATESWGERGRGGGGEGETETERHGDSKEEE